MTKKISKIDECLQDPGWVGVFFRLLLLVISIIGFENLTEAYVWFDREFLSTD